MKKLLFVLLLSFVVACGQTSTPVSEQSAAALTVPENGPSYERTKPGDAKSYDDLANIESGQRAIKGLTASEIQEFADAYMRFAEHDPRARTAVFRLVKEILTEKDVLPSVYEKAAMTVVPLWKDPNNSAAIFDTYKLLSAHMPETFLLEYRYDKDGMARLVTGEDPFTNANTIDLVGGIMRFSAATNQLDAQGWKMQYADALVTSHPRCSGCDEKRDGVAAYALYGELADKDGRREAAAVAGSAALDRYVLLCGGERGCLKPIDLVDARVWFDRAGLSAPTIDAKVKDVLTQAIADAKKENLGDAEVAALQYVLEHGRPPEGYYDGTWKAPTDIADATPPAATATQ